METLYWQIGIIAVIVASKFFLPKATVWVCIGWTAWTFEMLFYPPLIIVQLGSIWGTWFFLRTHDKKSRQIAVRDEVIRNLSVEARSAIREIPLNQIRIIEGKQHMSYLKEQIRKAKGGIVILSGWISDGVVNDELVDLLDRKLQNGNEVHIGYGWEDSSGQHSEWPAAARARKKLERLKQRYHERLHVTQFATHEKMLIVDNEIVYGSNNWLSNSSFRNSERSIAVVSRELAVREQSRVKNSIRTCELR